MASRPEQSVPVKFCQLFCHTAVWPLGDQPVQEGVGRSQFHRQEQRKRVEERPRPRISRNEGVGTSELTASAWAPLPALVAALAFTEHSVCASTGLPASQCVVSVKRPSHPLKSFPNHVPWNPKAFLAVIRCF